MSEEYRDGNLERNHISGQEHALRVAAYAQRHMPDNDEAIFSALVHDLARPLSDIYHGEVIAEIVRDIVSKRWYNVLRTHGEYQSNYLNRTPLESDTPWYPEGRMMCAWEVGSFKIPYEGPEMSYVTAVALISEFCKGK